MEPNPLKIRRQMAGKTQAEVAKTLVVSRQAVALWEKRGRVPTWAVGKLAGIYRCGVSQLFDLRGASGSVR